MDQRNCGREFGKRLGKGYRRRRLAAAVAAVILAASLAGCGSAEEPTTRRAPIDTSKNARNLVKQAEQGAFSSESSGEPEPAKIGDYTTDGAKAEEGKASDLREIDRLTTSFASENKLMKVDVDAPVLVAEEAALYPLLSPELRAALRESRGRPPEERLELLWSRGLGSGFRLLPYRSVGVEGGLLLCFRPQAAALAGRPVPGLTIALSPTPIRGPFEAVVGTT